MVFSQSISFISVVHGIECLVLESSNVWQIYMQQACGPLVLLLLCIIVSEHISLAVSRSFFLCASGGPEHSTCIHNVPLFS